MQDLIDRQAAMDECYPITVDGEVYEVVQIETLMGLPSAQRWIPCSERLPEDGIEVFVYLFNQPSPFIAWIEDTRWHTEYFEVEREDEPIAWMPLPEAWKGE